MLNSCIAAAIQRMHGDGFSNRSIASNLTVSPATVGRYVFDPCRGLRTEKLARPKPFKLDAGNQEALHDLFLQSKGNCSVAKEKISRDPVRYGLPADFVISLRSVNRYGHARWPDAFVKKMPDKVMPFHCEPGQQLQIDFVRAKFRFDGENNTDEPVEVYFFEAVYSWSRKIFIRVCPDMTQTSWLLSIAQCLAKFGVPRSILCDNDKGLVIRHDWKRDEVKFNPAFLWLCKPLGIKPRACRPARPATKGRIERVGRYLKFNGLIDISIDSEIRNVAELQTAIDKWCEEVSDRRKFKFEDKSLTVKELYQREKSYLLFPENLASSLNVSTWMTRLSSNAGFNLFGTHVTLPRRLAEYNVFVTLRANGEYLVSDSEGKTLHEDRVPLENLTRYKRDDGPEQPEATTVAVERPTEHSTIDAIDAAMKEAL